jgi:hypothetical protein
MTDREMLELAALAAGQNVWFPRLSDGKGGVLTPCHTSRGGETVEWNPLADDGDALRLAVHLGILLRTNFIRLLGDLLDSGVDHRYATRLAIVRIAAEIGKLKKEASND